MKNCLLIIVANFIFSCSCSQIILDEPLKNGLYVEAGGNAILYSLNYERRFYFNGSPRFTARVGFATLFAEEPFLIPAEINYLFGNNITRYYAQQGSEGNPKYSFLIFTPKTQAKDIKTVLL